MVTYTLADKPSVLGLSLEGTLGDTGELVDDTVNSLNVGKREAPEPEVNARILGMLGGRKKRQAEQVQTRILGGLMGRKKRQAEQVQTRILGGLMGRKKRDLTLDQVVDIADILQ